MPPVIRTHLLPQLVDPGALSGGVAIIIDQLRASTTICAALASGAAGVCPFLEPDHALHARDHLATVLSVHGPLILGGERGGVAIPGFDLDNSPLRYTPATVGGKIVLFTTTNGTRAVEHARRAASVLIGCLGNVSALAAQLLDNAATIHLICAGTGNRITLEDTLAAGAIADRLLRDQDARHPAAPHDHDDSTLLALNLWRSTPVGRGAILEVLRASRGGRNLAQLGFHEDIAFCATLDRTPVVPWLSPEGRFVIASAD